MLTNGPHAFLPSGHVTATELKGALEWINAHPFGDRVGRKIDYLYILPAFKRADRNKSLTLEYDEFVDLLLREKLLFAETLFTHADTENSGKLSQKQVRPSYCQVSANGKGKELRE